MKQFETIEQRLIRNKENLIFFIKKMDPRVREAYNKGDPMRHATLEDVINSAWNLEIQIFNKQESLLIAEMNYKWHKKQLRKYSDHY